MSIPLDNIPSDVTFGDIFKEESRQSREILQAKVRQVGTEFVVFVRWYDFVVQRPSTEWIDHINASWAYPNYDTLLKQVMRLCDGEMKVGPICKRMNLHFSKMIYACDVAKALVDFYQPFGHVCDMYDEAMNIVYSLDKAYFVVFYNGKRHNLYDVKRGIRLMPQCPSENSKEFYEQLLTLLRDNAIFPKDIQVTHK